MVALTLTRPVSLLPNIYLKPHKGRIEKFLFYNTVNRENFVLYFFVWEIFVIYCIDEIFKLCHNYRVFNFCFFCV